MESYTQQFSHLPHRIGSYLIRAPSVTKNNSNNKSVVSMFLPVDEPSRGREVGGWVQNCLTYTLKLQLCGVSHQSGNSLTLDPSACGTFDNFFHQRHIQRRRWSWKGPHLFYSIIPFDSRLGLPLQEVLQLSLSFAVIVHTAPCCRTMLSLQ